MEASIPPGGRIPVVTTATEGAEIANATLPIEGMTCASCVRRVERSLTKVPGVAAANVNLATEKAQVAFDPKLGSIELLNQAVEKAGYHVGKMEIPAATAGAAAEEKDEPGLARDRDIRDLKQRALVSLAIGIGLMAF